MKRTPTLFLFLLFLASCGNPKKETGKSENNIDAARNFIRAALDGNFDLAKRFMIQDSTNLRYIELAERSFNRLSKDTINGYRGASIQFFEPAKNVNDSTTIVIYTNSFFNNPDTLKVLRREGGWLVDLKYLYEHDMDTLLRQSPVIDSVK